MVHPILTQIGDFLGDPMIPKLQLCPPHLRGERRSPRRMRPPRAFSPLNSGVSAGIIVALLEGIPVSRVSLDPYISATPSTTPVEADEATLFNATIRATSPSPLPATIFQPKSVSWTDDIVLFDDSLNLYAHAHGG